MLPVLVSLVLAMASMWTACDGAKLTPVADFGDNPSKITMAIYVPDKLPPKPAIMVLVRNQ
jgi:acetylxylan esterase